MLLVNVKVGFTSQFEALILALLLAAVRPLPSLIVTGVFRFAATVVASLVAFTPDQLVGKTTKPLPVAIMVT